MQEARASRRLRGSDIDRNLMFQDPEAIMRAQRQVNTPLFEINRDWSPLLLTR